MDEKETHSEPTLKVSDRRHFTHAGERREDAPPEAPEPPPAAVAPAPAPAAAPAPENAPEKASDKGAPPEFKRLAAREITFVELIEQLYASALMHLGAMAPPGQAPQTDLEGARETIDLLGLLQQKTHGNLTAQEESLLKNALYELRVGYTQVAGAAQSRIAVPPPPRMRR